MKDFNPRSPSGLRLHVPALTLPTNNFNPRSPSGLRLLDSDYYVDVTVFQSTQPEWAATLPTVAFWRLVVFQSTQPEWAATSLGLEGTQIVQISIHAARVGCDTTCVWKHGKRSTFQSTQPEWAATAKRRNKTCALYNFNPRSPSGLRHRQQFF